MRPSASGLVRRRASAGQALIEAIIALPIMIFVVLGVLQIMMVQHAKVITEYAAYNAARAGIVHNANWQVMRNAALVSALPLYGRTDSMGALLGVWARVQVVAGLTSAIDLTSNSISQITQSLLGLSFPLPQVSLIEVNVTSPDTAAFASAADWQTRQQQRATQLDPQGPLEYPEGEIDFDDLYMLRDNPEVSRLGVEVRVLYPLRIPLLNKIIFELYMARELLNATRFTGTYTDWVKWRTKLGNGQDLDEAIHNSEGQAPLQDLLTTSQWTQELRILRWVANEYNIYLLPVKASYAMQMQSNMFQHNARAPSWFSIGGGS